MAVHDLLNTWLFGLSMEWGTERCLCSGIIVTTRHILTTDSSEYDQGVRRLYHAPAEETRTEAEDLWLH